jgi:hypothetical protein
MRKSKTFSKVSFIIIILTVILGVTSNVYAREATGTIRFGDREENKNKIQDLKDESRKEIAGAKEQAKNKIQDIVNTAKQERLEFKNKVETIKQEAKTKTEEIKSKFKEGLDGIKDERKKASTLSIIDSINNLNARLTSQLLDKISQIENVVLGIESRIAKGEEGGLNVSKVKETLVLAKTKLAAAKESVLAQQAKVYTATVTDEATLKAKIKEVRDGFKADIKVARGVVVSAHEAVKNVAVALAQIKGIDDETE